MMIKALLIFVAACLFVPHHSLEARPVQEQTPMKSELVALEFSGSRRSIDKLEAEAVGLGWRVESRAARALRILPPPAYEPSQFGLLLERIERMGLNDIGLKLIGPNGPVGPEG